MASRSVGDSSLQCRVRNTFLDFKRDSEFKPIPRALSAENLQALQGQKATNSLSVPCHSLQLQDARKTKVTGPNHIEQYSCAMPYPEEEQHTRMPSARSCHRKAPPIYHEDPNRAHLREKGLGLRIQNNPDWSEFNLEGRGVDTEHMQFPPQTNLRLIHGNTTKSNHTCVQASNSLLASSTRGEVTTLLVRNVVCSYTDQEILQILDAMGLKGKYDFIYVPKGSPNQANFGYFFLNLKSPEYVKDCENLILGRRFGPRTTNKVCEVAVADLQGTDLITHIQKKRVKRGFVPTITWALT